MEFNGGVAQSVRACGSYPQCPGFDSLHRHHFFLLGHMRVEGLFCLCEAAFFVSPGCVIRGGMKLQQKSEKSLTAAE